jgi:uncharacterized protein (UPF0264 family)
MTGLLVSIRSGEEAADALAGGADLIDVKEPLDGPLGAASPQIVADVLRSVAGRRPTSIALGELIDGRRWSTYAEHLAPRELPRFVKYGLAGCGSLDGFPERWRNALAELPVGIEPVAVVYADWQLADAPEPEVVLSLAAEMRCGAMLVDTFDKRGPGLLGLWSIDALARFVATTRARNLMVVLGGQVSAEQVDTLLPLEPDFIAVRGAVCRGDRAGQLDPRRVERLHKRIVSISESREGGSRIAAT